MSVPATVFVAGPGGRPQCPRCGYIASAGMQACPRCYPGYGQQGIVPQQPAALQTVPQVYAPAPAPRFRNSQEDTAAYLLKTE